MECAYYHQTVATPTPVKYQLMISSAVRPSSAMA